MEYLGNTPQVMENFLDVRVNNGQYEILVQWEGWPNAEDMTWESLSQLQEDVPGIVKALLHTSGKHNLKSRMLATFK